jgi:tRNA(Arg) A34 adenosine deaminase TadA
MCLGALYWARPARIFFAATKDEASAAGFDDSFIYREILVPLSERTIPTLHVNDETTHRPFEEWDAKSDKTAY